MSHVVQVLDPWFGNFQRVALGGSWPSWVVGPLMERPISLEVMRNFGCLAEANHVREKNCQHSYVDGIVTGNPGQASTQVLPLGSGGFTKTQIYGKVKYEYVVTQTVSYDPSAGFGQISAKCVYTYYYDGVPQSGYPKTGGIDVGFKVTTDTLSGARTYGSMWKKRIWGDCPTNAYTTAVTNPYGGGGDGLGGRVKDIRSWINLAFLKLPPVGPQATLRNEAIWKALENTTVANINPLQDFSDLRDPLGLVVRLASHFRARSAQEALKNLANLHLFWSYVYKTNLLTASEIGTLTRYLSGGAQRAIDRVCNADVIGRGSSSVTFDSEYGTRTVKWTAKVVYGAGLSPFASLAKLRRLGVYPGVGDIWDMVPYSFVVDWVLPIQTYLDRADALMDTLHLPLKYLLLSKKVSDQIHHSFAEGTHAFRADVVKSYYNRTVHFSLPPDFWLGKLDFSNPLKHGLTGTALIIQRAR